MTHYSLVNELGSTRRLSAANPCCGSLRSACGVVAVFV